MLHPDWSHRTVTDIIGDLRKMIGLNGDTYSSAEVIGLLNRAANEINQLRLTVQHEADCVESADDEAMRRGHSLDEADALIMELVGVPFPVAYPTGSSKATAMQNWKARCVKRGNNL